MLNCIIIDDEQFSVDALLKYIGLMPELNVVGIYNDPLIALKTLSAEKGLSLLFMDVDMPNLSGLELAAALRPITQKLIFTTAHSKYAFDAFEAAADAFLLKPFSFGKFSTTINRLFPSKNPAQNVLQANNEYFLVKSKEEDLAMVKICFSEIITFESSQNYVRIHLVGDKVLTAYLTLKDVLNLTGNRPEFQQFHRAFVISTNQISRIKGTMIHLSNSVSFPVGDLYRDAFSAYLGEKLLLTSRKA